MNPPSAAVSSTLSSPSWVQRLVLVGRPTAPVAGLDDVGLLNRMLLTALAIWGFGLAAFVTVLSRLESVTVAAVLVYLALGPVLVAGHRLAARTGRMPGLVLLAVIVWTSLLGTVSGFYYDVAPITTVALCTAFVSWMGTRVAPVYALATVVGLALSGVVQQAPDVIDRTIVTGLAVVFAVSIVGRSSDSSRTAHHDREVLLARLAHESRHDALTGIGNRKLLIDQAHLALGEPGGPSLALALVDLDGFKLINDTYGHAVGDEVLRIVGARLRLAVRRDDTVVRIGGDEFAVLFGAGAITRDDIHRRLAAVTAQRVTVDGLSIEVTVSAGVAMEERAETSLEQLLAGADDEMYDQKRNPRLRRRSVSCPSDRVAV